MEHWGNRIECLSNEHKKIVLSHFLVFFSQEMRDCYISEEISSVLSANKFRAGNEVVQIISKQLLGELGGRDIPYPYSSFTSLLVEVSTKGTIESEVHAAWDRSFEKILS